MTGLKAWWLRVAIAICCMVLAVLHLVCPDLAIDWVTVALVGIAAAVLLMPRVRDTIVKWLPYVKRVNVGGVEIELSDAIQRLANDVEKAEEEVADQKTASIQGEFRSSQQQVLASIADAPRASLLLLGALIERQVMDRVQDGGLIQPNKFTTLRAAFAQGVEAGIFPESIQEPFMNFWKIRNQVAHGVASHVSDSAITSLVSVGLEILRVLSVVDEKRQHDD